MLTEELLQHACAIKSNQRGALTAFENYLNSQSDEIISVINELQDYLDISFLEESIFREIKNRLVNNISDVDSEFVTCENPESHSPFYLKHSQPTCLAQAVIKKSITDHTLDIVPCLSSLDLNSGGHTDLVWSVAFSPDGNTLVSGLRDRTIKLWDITSLHNPQIITMLDRNRGGHTGSVLAVAFSPDGNTLASGSLDATIKLWDLASYNDLVQKSTLPQALLVYWAQQYRALHQKKLCICPHYNESLLELSEQLDGKICSEIVQDSCVYCMITNPYVIGAVGIGAVVGCLLYYTKDKE